MSVVPSPERRTFKTYLNFVKFEHTLFALPFAYGGMLLAERGWPGFVTFFWITMAMVGARTASMALNRVIDADLDARNPRTRTREIPKGVLTKRNGVVLAVLSFLLLGLAGWALNPLTLVLLPVAVFFLALYPYTKRFTPLCHYWLGLTIGAAAAGGWIAVTGARLRLPPSRSGRGWAFGSRALTSSMRCWTLRLSTVVTASTASPRVLAWTLRSTSPRRRTCSPGAASR